MKGILKITFVIPVLIVCESKQSLFVRFSPKNALSGIQESTLNWKRIERWN